MNIIVSIVMFLGLTLLIYRWLKPSKRAEIVLLPEANLGPAFNMQFTESLSEIDSEVDSDTPRDASNFNLQESGVPKQFEFQPYRLLFLHIIAKPGRVFTGYELLQAFSLHGLRHGAMNVFHQYINDDPNEGILFSVAQATEPGSFELSDLGAISCVGLTCFCDLTQQANPLAAFEKMMSCVLQLAEELYAQVLDHDKQPFRSETYQLYRQGMAQAYSQTLEPVV